ncbi:MAG: (d)CMP kinase [Clostridiales bacterium]|nr:(d)CMP kinase [Clostridiales bacterium]
MTARIIAIDGPAGAGKSTIAKLAAKRLGYLYIDTGAMYRVVALCAIREGVAFGDEAALGKIAARVKIELRHEGDLCRVFCDGEDVSAAIRTPEVSAAASPVSAVRPVREALVAQQRALAATGGVVMDGRDIGTYVFPGADCKIFLTAGLTERAARRAKELEEKGYPAEAGAVALELLQRDARDSGRALAPLCKAEDAFELDSTELSIGQVVEKVLALARGDRGGAGPPAV